MKLSVAKDQNDQPEANLIELNSVRGPESAFARSCKTLAAMGARHDIARSLASYAAFHGEEFDPNSSILEHFYEEIGQEPSVQGRMAA